MKFYVDLEAAYNDPSGTMLARAWKLEVDPEAIEYFESLNGDQERAKFLLQVPIISDDLALLKSKYQVLGYAELYVRAHQITEKEFIDLGGEEEPKGPQLPPFL